MKPAYRLSAVAVCVGLLSAPYSVLAATDQPAYSADNILRSEIYHFEQANPLADFSDRKSVV